MSNTYGGWNPQDPYRDQDPDQYGQAQHGQAPHGQAQHGQTPQQLDPYGRPINPYGRPDYYQQGAEPATATRRQQQLPYHAASDYPASDPATGRTGGGPATVGAAWRWGWSAFGASWGTWVVMSLVLGVAQLAIILVFSPSTLSGLLNATDPAAIDAAQAAGTALDAKALSAAGTAVCFMFQVLLYAGALAATRARKVRLRDFFALRGVLGLIGYAVIVGLLGFIGTAVPMVGLLVQVVFTLLLLPVPFLLLKGYGFGRSLGAGVGLVLSHIGAAVAIFGIFAGLAIASVFTCGIGLVVVGPVMLLVGAYLVQRWTGDEVGG